MERIYGRKNDSNLNFIKEASCKEVSTCMNLSAIFMNLQR